MDDSEFIDWVAEQQRQLSLVSTGTSKVQPVGVAHDLVHD